MGGQKDALGPFAGPWILKQNIIDQVAYAQQTFISHSLEAGKFKITVLVDIV